MHYSRFDEAFKNQQNKVQETLLLRTYVRTYMHLKFPDSSTFECPNMQGLVMVSFVLAVYKTLEN